MNQKKIIVILQSYWSKKLIDFEKRNFTGDKGSSFIMYFPEGENKIQGILLIDVEFYIGNYAGKPLKSILKKEKVFSLEN